MFTEGVEIMLLQRSAIVEDTLSGALTNHVPESRLSQVGLVFGSASVLTGDVVDLLQKVYFCIVWIGHDFRLQLIFYLRFNFDNYKLVFMESR